MPVNQSKCYFHKYSKIFGEIGKGVHKYRLFNLAIMDIIMTIIGGIIIAYFFNLSYIKVIIILFLSGIILHRLFCVRTTIDKLLFPKE